MRSAEQTTLPEDAHQLVRRPLFSFKLQAALCIVASILVTLTLIWLTWRLV